MINGPLADFLSTYWFRLCFGATLVVPAALFQTVSPLIPEEAWERASEPVYATLRRYAQPAAGDSRVVILEADEKSIRALKWPISRDLHSDLLDKLQASGRPWVQSSFQFDANATSAADDRLADAIARYERYIGSGLELTADGTGIDASDEDTLIPRILLSSRNLTVDDLPAGAQLNLREDGRFVAGQAKFGPPVAYGTEPVVYCGQLYHTDKDHTGAVLFPSALAWTAALASDRGLRTSTGAAWPRSGEPPPPRGRLNVAYRHCVSTPGVLTEDLLTQRGIQRVSFVDFLDSKQSFDFRDKVVLIAKEDMRKYRGPGRERAGDDGVVSEHLITARLLDDLLAGVSIRRDPLSLHTRFAWTPLAAAMLLILVSLVLPPVGVALAAGAGVVALLLFAAFNLKQGLYLIPIQALASVSTTSALLSLLAAYLKYYGIRRQVAFSHRATHAFAQCNTLGEIEAEAMTLLRGEFKEVHIVVGCMDRALYDASGDPQAALAWLGLHRAATLEEPQAPTGQGTALTRVKRPKARGRMPFRAHGLDVQLAIESKRGRLGTVRISLAHLPHEAGFAGAMLEALRVELCQHWHRIRILVDQNLLAYKFLMEQTRGEILKRFLTQALVSRFSDARTMEENLKLVLTPRPTRAALMQADIRGYSKLSARLSPAEMVRILQGYFRDVVDAATAVAQVKLIGDCIFLFIEEDAGTKAASPVDLAVDLAAILVRETMAQNNLRATEGIEALNFGIAIHEGEVVVGNLSSDHCIDYTVIGPNVNLVARLEEATKNPVISDRIGANGLILSEDAARSLRKHHALALLPLRLADFGVAIRSFGEIASVQGVSAAALLEISAASQSQKPAQSSPTPEHESPVSGPRSKAG